MRHLYEIDAALAAAVAAAEAAAEENEGEIGDALAEKLDALETERGEKIGNICRYIKSIQAEADAVKAEAAKLTDRARVTQNRADAVKAYLAAWMDEGEKYADENSKVSWRKAEGVTVTDDEAVPDEYAQVVEQRKIDKGAIKKALKGGAEVAGAVLYTRYAIQVK